MEKNRDLVIHHNYINESIFNFNELELNLFVVIIYKMREEKSNNVIFDAKEIKSLINSNERSYKTFEKIAHALQDRTIHLKTEKGYKRIKPFPVLDFNLEDKTIEIQVSDVMIPFFKELKKEFTQYSLKEFLNLKSKHAKRLYQLLKQYQSIKTRTINITDLKDLLECNTKSYEKSSNFDKRVLIRAKQEINENTSLKIDYEKIKSGKEVSEIKFTIEVKDTKTDKKETRKEIVDRALESFEVKYIKDLNYRQKVFLDSTLKSAGYKPTATKIKGEIK